MTNNYHHQQPLTELTSFRSEAIAVEHDVVVGASLAQWAFVVVIVALGAELLVRLAQRPDLTVGGGEDAQGQQQGQGAGADANAELGFGVHRRKHPSHDHRRNPSAASAAAAASVAFAATVAAFVAHYADNIARPGAYAEPKWMFDARLVAQMEITFFGGVLKWWLMRNYALRAPWQRLWLAAIGTLSLGHYVVAPPSRYSLWCHTTILADGICPSVLYLLTTTAVTTATATTNNLVAE